MLEILAHPTICRSQQSEHQVYPVPELCLLSQHHQAKSHQVQHVSFTIVTSIRDLRSEFGILEFRGSEF